MQADYDARNLTNIIPKVVIAAHSADGCFTDSRPQGQLLLRSAAVMNQLHKGSRRAARKGFEILRIFLIQCFFTQILIQIQGANQRIGTISTFASLLIAFPPFRTRHSVADAAPKHNGNPHCLARIPVIAHFCVTVTSAGSVPAWQERRAGPPYCLAAVTSALASMPKVLYESRDIFSLIIIIAIYLD